MASPAPWWDAAANQFPAHGHHQHLGASSSTSGPFTPTRPLYAASGSTPAHTHGHRARFNISDELDPEDARMAENIRFAPSFAASPAGKLVLGQTPGGNVTMGSPGDRGSAGSPPGSMRAGRSPTGRFGGGGADSAASPRDSRRKTYTQVIDEDMPPTTSLRDPSASDSPAKPFSAQTPSETPAPASRTLSAGDTSLHIFGPPLHLLPNLESYLAQAGTIQSYRPDPNGGNWWIVTYDKPVGAAWAMQKHGEVVMGRYLLGVSVARGESSTAAGASGGGEGAGGEVVRRSEHGGGTPLTIHKSSILRAPAETKRPGEWDENAGGNGEAQGYSGKLADWLDVGRAMGSGWMAQAEVRDEYGEIGEAGEEHSAFHSRSWTWAKGERSVG